MTQRSDTYWLFRKYFPLWRQNFGVFFVLQNIKNPLFDINNRTCKLRRSLPGNALDHIHQIIQIQEVYYGKSSRRCTADVA